MPTAAYDLINLNSLVLTDTFNTMYNRVNQVIDAINPLQVYDVVAAPTGGLSTDANASSGVISIKVNPGPGIGTYNYGGQSRTIVDFALFDTYNLTATGASNGFYVQNSDAGIVAYGASGNKTFLWTYNDADSGQNINAWVSNTNLGVVGANSAIVSRYFRSYGYTGVSTSQFIFVGENGDTELYFAQNATDPSSISLTGHIWKITRSQSVNDLIFSYGSSGNVNAVSELFRIVGGASGTTFPGVTATNFAKSFNSDMLDGAHGYQISTPYGIPIADAYGRIDGSWLSASAISRTFTITGHTFTVGNVVRITATGAYALAYANDEEHAEAIGMVGSVNGNDVYIVNEGRITGLSGAMMTPDALALVAGLFSYDLQPCIWLSRILPLMFHSIFFRNFHKFSRQS